MAIKEQILQSADSCIFDKYGKHILTAEGKLDVENAISTIELLTKEYRTETEITVDSEEAIFADIMKYVPPEVKEKIQLATEYVLSGFDKVQCAVAELSKEFQITRKGAIINAKKEIVNISKDYSSDSRQIIIGCINDVGKAIEEISEYIKDVSKIIDEIPKDRKKRLFTIPIKKRLEDVKSARVYIGDYIYATGVYAELNMKIGRKEAAISRMQETIDFLNKMKKEGNFDRIEQWNEMKDLFWKTGIDQLISLLEKRLSEVRDYSKEILFLEGEF